MKTFILSFIITISLIFPLQAQTAEQIIAKHLETTGGVNRWKGFNSAILKGEIILGINENYKIEIFQQRPNLTKTTMFIDGKKIILNGYNGQKAIKYNFYTNKLENDSNYTPETFDSDLLDYANKGFQVFFIGTEKVENSNCYKIKLIKNLNTSTYYFDIKTYQLLREENPLEVKTYSNFITSSNLTFPHKIEVKSTDNSSDFVLIINTVEVNKVISAQEFKF